MGNEPNCSNFCCDAKTASDKPAEDVVLSEFILGCQICSADVKHPSIAALT
jgi:Pyruvate/2-oxoacid:ferredoxin oxidoreductase delta subunit